MSAVHERCAVGSLKDPMTRASSSITAWIPLGYTRDRDMPRLLDVHHRSLYNDINDLACGSIGR